MSAIVLRRCDPEADLGALRRLAERDSAPPLSGPALGAEAGGELRAAICLDCGRVVADPFHPTAGLVELLRARAAQLRPPRDRRRTDRRERCPAPWSAAPTGAPAPGTPSRA